jgi:outer membrane protein assembly factor BamB
MTRIRTWRTWRLVPSLPAALFGLWAASAAAADWPQYKRDAARTADAADESLAFPLQRVLAVRFPSPIYASAAVVGGRVYAVDARGLLACVDVAKRQVLWTAEIGGVANRSSPAVTGGKVFVGSTAGYLLVLDAGTGREVARVPAAGGVIAAPAATNDAVYGLTFNGQLLKVDLAGKLLWTFSGGKVANAEFAVQGRKAVFQAGPVDETGVAEPYAWHVVEDLGDHAERRLFLRRAELEGGKTKLTKNPADSDCGLFQREGWIPQLGATRRGNLYLIRELGLVPGTVCWGGPSGARVMLPGYQSQPVLAGNHVVVGDADGRISFFDALPARNFGGKPVWSCEAGKPGKPNAGVSATAAISDGIVFVGGEDGLLSGFGRGAETAITNVLSTGSPARPLSPAGRLQGLEWPTIGGDMSYCALSPDKNLRPPFKLLWKTRIGGSGAQNSVIVAAGKVFMFSHNGFVEALDAATGDILWRTYQAGILRNGEYGNDGPPTYADGRLLVVRRNGLWCHDAATGELLWRNPQPELPVPGGAPQGDGLVVREGKVLIAWNGGSNAVETAALDLGTGRETWRVRHENVFPALTTDVRRSFFRVCQGALGEDKWFISACICRATGETPCLGGSTLALDPANGKELWRNTDRSIGGYGGLNYRNGTVVVFHTSRGRHALDARNGNLLWSISGQFGSGAGPWHLAPLTDELLASQGRKGFAGGYCMDTVWVNGVVYGPPNCAAHVLSARKLDGPELWRHVVISRGCPAPAPAYGRLYYAGNGEGVVYCFVNDDPAHGRP